MNERLGIEINVEKFIVLPHRCTNCDELLHVLTYTAETCSDFSYDLICLDCDLKWHGTSEIKAVHVVEKDMKPKADETDEADYDFEYMATDLTACGRAGRKHRMKRIHHSKTICIYPDCDGYC